MARETIIKYPFEFVKRDGVLLSVHNSGQAAELSDGSDGRIQFSNVAFTDNNEVLATIDTNGNMFLFNLKTQLFWTLPHVKIENSTCMTFVPATVASYSRSASHDRNNADDFMGAAAKDSDLILIGTADGKIFAVNLEMATISSRIDAHFDAVKRISFTAVCNRTRMYFLSHTIDDVKIYELENFQLKYELNRTVGCQPQQVIVGGRLCQNFISMEPGWAADTQVIAAGFLPHTSKVYVGLSNDSIQVWNWGLKMLRQTVHPLRMRQRYLRHYAAEQLDAFYDSDEERMDEIVVNITRDTGKSVAADIVFSRNGVYCCVPLQFLNELIIFCTATATICRRTTYTASTAYIPLWQVYKVIKLNDFAIATAKFISPWVAPSHPMARTTIDAKYLTLLSTTSELLLINVDELCRKVLITRTCGKFVVASNGKMLAGVSSETGAVLVHSLQHFFDKIFQRKIDVSSTRKSCGFGPMNRIEKRLEKIHNEMNKIISRSRLLPILNEFGCYPAKYRQTIWKNILKLPQNSHQSGSNKAFTTLLRKGLHPCVAPYDTQFPLFDQKAVRNLKKMCSSLAHWSNLFAHLPFLAGFVFPFLKHWRFDSVSCFETLATILLNQGQLWFEFAPLEPYNYLGMIENLLAHFDPALMHFYQQQQVGVHTYAWAMLQNALSEVFAESDWLHIWDHILTNEPNFLMFLLCAYNVIQREQILRCRTMAEIQAIFHDQATLNAELLLQKCYKMIKSCPPAVHPGQYMQEFRPLRIDVDSGHYQSFNYFPKMLFDAKTSEMTRLRDEERQLQSQFVQLETMANTLTDHIEEQTKAKVHQHRMRDIESQFNETVVEEEQKLAYLRQLLLQYQKEIREKEDTVLLGAINCTSEEKLASKHVQLKTVQKQIKREKCKAEADLLFQGQQDEIDALAEQLNMMENKQFETFATEDLSVSSGRQQQQRQRRHRQCQRLVNKERNETEAGNNENLIKSRSDGSNLLPIVEAMENKLKILETKMSDTNKEGGQKSVNGLMDLYEYMNEMEASIYKEIHQLQSDL